MRHNNTARTLNVFLKSLNIPVTLRSIEEELSKHPDRYSLLALTDILNCWKIPNAAYQLSSEQILEEGVPIPFVAHFSDDGGSFVVIESIGNVKATIVEGDLGKRTITMKEFNERYTGSILVANYANDAGEVNYHQMHRREVVEKTRIPFIIVSVIILLLINSSQLFSSFGSIEWSKLILFILKTGGFLASIFLLIQSIDNSNPLIQKLCGTNKDKNCNAILSSRAAKITEEVSWSELGYFYFAGTWFIILFSGHNNAIMQTLSLLNLLCLPYTFYSFFYQWRIAKQWCILCCTVLILLWAEFFTLFPFLSLRYPNLHSNDFRLLIISMTIPILVWVFIKPLLLRAKQLKPLNNQLRTFKYDSELFNKLINAEVKYPLLDDESSFVIGDDNASTVITVVSNPFCEPCAHAHRIIDEWLGYKQDIKLQIVFPVNLENDDAKLQVVSHLLAVKEARGINGVKSALKDWYERKYLNYDTWSNAHAVEQKVTDQSSIIKQAEWCRLTNIQSTPMIFINGRKLPSNYQLDDIKYII